MRQQGISTSEQSLHAGNPGSNLSLTSNWFVLNDPEATFCVSKMNYLPQPSAKNN